MVEPRRPGAVRLQPGERLDRDFILRSGWTPRMRSALTLVPRRRRPSGTFALTVVLPPPEGAARPPRDVVLLLDRSGSMDGWKMVAARRAAARIVDTLTPADRFACCRSTRWWSARRARRGLVDATDRNRYRAVEHLARLDARGGTEMLQPLQPGLALLDDPARTGTGSWSWSPTARWATRTRSSSGSARALAASGCTPWASTGR